LLEATANKTMKTVKIKLQETQGFNVENPSNAKGKKLRAPASKNFTISGVCLQHQAAAYKRNNKLWSKF